MPRTKPRRVPRAGDMRQRHDLPRFDLGRVPDFRMHSENPPLTERAWRSAGVLEGPQSGR